MHQGAQQGAVSNLFALIAGWAFSSASGVVLSSGFGLAAAVLAALGVGLAAVIVQSPLLYLATVAAVVLAVVVLSGRGVEERTNGALLFAAGLVLLAAGIGMLFPRAGGGNDYIDLILHPKMRAVISATLPRFPLLYSIPGYGTQHEERRLGGTPVLSPRPLLRIYSPEARTLYLRTEVFEHYDGITWAPSRKITAEAADTSRFIREQPLRKVKGSDVRIDLLADAYDRLPHTVDTIDFAVVPDAPYLPTADYARGFFLSEAIMRGTSITLRRNPAIRTVGPPADPRYLQVPSSLPVEVRSLATEVTDGAESVTGHLRKIARYLKSSCIYSLTPPRRAVARTSSATSCWANGAATASTSPPPSPSSPASTASRRATSPAIWSTFQSRRSTLP